MRLDGVDWPFGELTEAFLRHANAAQAGLNRALGRAEGGPPVGFEDVVRML
ncbi:MAG: hypothetical protein ACRDZ9_03600 [Acidimicrobiales bacterium]